MIKSNIFGRGREAISRNFFYIGIWCIIKTAFKWRLGNLHRQKQGRGHDGGFLGQIGSSWDDDDDGPGSGIVVVSGRCHHREKFWMKVEVFTLDTYYVLGASSWHARFVSLQCVFGKSTFAKNQTRIFFNFIYIY